MYLLLDIYTLVAGIGRLLIQAPNIEEITVQFLTVLDARQLSSLYHAIFTVFFFLKPPIFYPLTKLSATMNMLMLSC